MLLGINEAAVKVQEKVQLFSADEEDSYFTLMKLYDLLNNAAAVAISGGA